MTARRIDEHMPAQHALAGIARPSTRGDFGKGGQRNDDHPARYGKKAQPGVKQEAPGDEQRDEGNVEKGRRPLAAEKTLELVGIADRLQGFSRRSALQGQERGGAKGGRRQLFVDAGANAAQNAHAQHIDGALKAKGGEREERQHHQRLDAAAQQHAVIDLKHVDRASQRQDVDHARKQPDREQVAHPAPHGAARQHGISRRHTNAGRRGRRCVLLHSRLLRGSA